MRITTALIACICFFSARSQQIKGVINDSINKTPLQYSNILLLKKQDSVLYKFSRSTSDGSFVLINVRPGKYILMITHPTYADFADTISVDDVAVFDIGSISMILKAHLLDSIFIRSTVAAMRMKGDTLEFRADSFKVKQGASVEDLLKKLPGIQVNKNGTITAQGQKVEKILVDGEEFFGDDPTIATKGLQADALDKVQVFDKKSDQANFTGIDDGETTKTLNLKLKEDRKKGYFGKIDLDAGTKDRWNNSAMINSFKRKRKLSAYTIMSSTGTTGLDWSDRNKYGEGNNMEYMEEYGGLVLFGGDDDDLESSAYSGEGLPKSWLAAIHYSNKFNGDKTGINSSYRYAKLSTEAFNNTVLQSLIPGNIYTTNSNSYSSSSKFRHAVNGIFDMQVDSFTSIKITIRGSKGESKANNNSLSNSTNEANQAINNSTNFTSSTADNDQMTSNLLLRRKFKKTGRTLSFNVEQEYKKTESVGQLLSTNTFYNNGLFSSSQLIDQQKQNDGNSNAITSRIVYTAPLTKHFFTEVSYGLRISGSNSERLSLNVENGKYTKLDTVFSNNYEYKFAINSPGINFKYIAKKLTASIGADVAFTVFKQKDLFHYTTIERDFTNLFPKANFAYKFSSNKRLSINYQGNTNQPTIFQLQPVKDNNNTTSIAEGNPNLKQEFRQEFRINYNSYKVFNESNFYFNANFTSTSNAISTNEKIDSIRRYQFINVNGNYSFSSWVGYGLKLKKLDVYCHLSGSLNLSNNISIINNEKNITKNTAPGINLSVYKGADKYNFSVRIGSNYNVSSSSVNKNIQTKYWSHSISSDGEIEFMKKFVVNISVDANFRQKINEADANNNVVLLNAYIGRKLFKNDKGLIKLSGYDILNQNKGFNRFVNNFTFQESRYQVLTQYFSLGILWNFSKTPAGMESSSF
jgi:hypothetical protein